MAKQVWKAGNMVYPLPAVMVSTADKEGNTNIFTVAWTGTLEAGQYVISATGGHGKSGGSGGASQHYHPGLGGNSMYQSAHGIDLRASGAIFLSDSEGDRRVCDQSDNRTARPCD